MNTEYKGHTINVTIAKNKFSQEVIWSTVINGRQKYKVFIEMDYKIKPEVVDRIINEALEDCKFHINMSEEQINNGEEIVQAEVVAEVTDPAEANACDSCQ